MQSMGKSFTRYLVLRIIFVQTQSECWHVFGTAPLGWDPSYLKHAGVTVVTVLDSTGMDSKGGELQKEAYENLGLRSRPLLL